MINQTKASASSGLLLAVHYRKAFDTIRRELIHHALEWFGFGEYITAAVRTLFNDIKTCIFNSGFSSGYFYPSRGIRQGCCCSPSLFVIAVELLAILVCKSSNIQGIPVAGHQIKISQYADDATFFASDSSSLDFLLQLLLTFVNLSGLHINYQKSHLLLLGNHLHPPTQHQGIKVCDTVTILGITFKQDMTDEQHYTFNFEPKLNKIKAICSTWMNRTLSMKGKVILITSLMSSILHYPCSNITTPMRVFIEFKKITTDFFWSNKKGKVAYNVLIQDISQGSIKLPDLMTRVKTSHLYWIKHLWDHPESIMAAVIKDALNCNDIHNLLNCKKDLATALHPSHTFLKDILRTWANLHIQEPKEEADIQCEMLWDNNFIRIQQQTVVWARWKEAGILYINDLLHDSQPRFLSHTELGQKYRVNISFLELLQIRAALPCLWKRKLTAAAQQDLTCKPTIYSADGDPVPILGKSSKFTYYLLIRFKSQAITSQRRWNEIFPINEADLSDYWADIYKRPYKTARNTKLQAFHFRVVHRFLPCNKFLSNIRIKRTDTCSFCTGEDTTQHFLFTCPIVQTFLTGVVAWFNRETGIQLNLSVRAFLFGVPDALTQAKNINFILLFTKFYIYRQKLFHQGSLILTHFLSELKTRLNVERSLTTSENRRHHFHKWQRTYAALG